MAPLWHHLGFPLNAAGVFPILNLDIKSFTHLFLMIPFTLDHNSAIYNI